MNWARLLMIGVFFVAFPMTAVLGADKAAGQILGGTPGAPLKMEVFSDFQCPSCREFYLQTVRPLLAEYSSANKVCVIYHEFPLNQHQYAKEAARYAEAAARFGREKLLAVYDVLFTDQGKWAQSGNLEESVAKVFSPEEMEQVKKIIREPAIDAAIDKEVELATKRKIMSTPTYILMTKGKKEKVEGFLGYTALKQAIDAMLK